MGIQWEIDFDYQAFEDTLYKASLKIFTDVQEKHSDEAFYNFSLYSTPLFGYVVPTCNSEEGLTRTAQRYVDIHHKAERHTDRTVEDWRIILRCGTPADFAYHDSDENDLIFEPSNNLLNEFEMKLEDLNNNNKEFVGVDGCGQIQELLFSRIEIVMLKVMSRLDSIHLFEKTNTRDKVTLGLRFGDQSDEEIARYTSMLNPFDVYVKFMNELKRGHRR